MKFNISHITEYLYSNSVFFEPHYLRLKPKITPYSIIESFDLQIEPKPQGFSEQIDIENNHIQFCWFENTYQKLKISVNTELEVSKYNPFNFLVYPSDYMQLPFKYSAYANQLLKPSLQAELLPSPMKNFLNEELRNSNNQTINFLTALTRRIHKEFILEIRDIGEPHKPEFTFQQKKGSCRDLAWMQIHLLRHLGIASRFVSGYFYLQSDNPEFELHAWVEAFLPGAGWIGFDPGHGLICGYNHIPLASSAFYESTMPVSGSIRGTATSKLNHELHISLVTS